MDLGRGFWPGDYGRLRSVHGIHRALGTPVRASRLWQHESAEPGGVSGRILERMAIHVQLVRGSCRDVHGWLRLVRLPPLFAARLGAGGAVRRVLRAARGCVPRRGPPVSPERTPPRSEKGSGPE